MALGMAMPFLGGGFASLRNRSAVRRVVALVFEARMRAITTGTPLQFSWRADDRAFTLSRGEEELSRFTLPEGLRVSEFRTPGRPPGEEPVRIVFYPAGDSSGGELLLEEDRLVYTLRVGIVTALPEVRLGS